MVSGFLRSVAGAAIIVAALAGTSLAQDDKVLATVNGATVTESDLALALQDLNENFQRVPEEQKRAAALSALIEIKLLAKKAVEAGYDQTDDFKRRAAFLNERALHEAVVAKDIVGGITDDVVRQRYDKEVAATPPANEVKARHILVETEEAAKAIITELEGGGDFEAIAKEKSTGPSGPGGGDLGWFGPGQMVPEFEQAAFTLNPGEFTKAPVQTQFGWHVIKVEDKRVQQPPAFEEVKEQMRGIVFRERYVELARQLREGATVEITDPELKAALEGDAQPESGN